MDKFRVWIRIKGKARKDMKRHENTMQLTMWSNAVKMWNKIISDFILCVVITRVEMLNKLEEESLELKDDTKSKKLKG